MIAYTDKLEESRDGWRELAMWWRCLAAKERELSDKLLAENQRLREALELVYKYATERNPGAFNVIEDAACKALEASDE